MSQIIHIVAMDNNGVIGINNNPLKGHQLPFDIPEDLGNFKSLTNDALIVMGFNTFKSILDNHTKKDSNGIYNFLPKRKVTVVCSTQEKALTRTKEYMETINNILFVSKDTFHILQSNNKKPIIIVGGGQLYKEYIPNIVLATIVNTNVIDNQSNVKYPWFDRINTNYFQLPYQTQTSKTNTEYTNNVFIRF